MRAKGILKTLALMAVSVCTTASLCCGWPLPPEVWISDWLHCVGPGEHLSIEAEDWSGTYIQDWDWQWQRWVDWGPFSGYWVSTNPPPDPIEHDGGYDQEGYYASSLRNLSFVTPWAYKVDVEAENSYGLTDDDYAEVYVIAVSIDDDPPNRDTAEYMAYQSSTPADIYYTILPNNNRLRYYLRWVADLLIKDQSGATIKSIRLGDGLGPQQTTWDGKKNDGTRAAPGTYTAVIQLTIPRRRSFTDSHLISVIQVDIDVDSNHNGTVDGTPAEEDLEETQAAIVPVNIDDDDPGTPAEKDCDNGHIDGSADLTDLLPVQIRETSLPTGWKAFTEIVDDSGNLITEYSQNAFMQVFDGDTPGAGGSVHVLGFVCNGGSWSWVNSLEVTTVIGSTLNWYIEAYRFSNSVGEACYLRLRIQDQGGGSVFTDEVVKLRSSPFILLPGYASSEVVYSPDRSDSDQDDDIAAVGTSIVSMDLGTTYAGDPWLQDAAEIGYTKWPGGQMHVVMDLPRQGRALDSWPNSLLAPSVGVFTVGSGNPKYDYGGNIEAVADEHVVVGTGCSGDITNFIAAQGVQSVIVSPQTGYLSVGHIDELVSFNGTSAYIVDVDLGISLVENFINNNTQANGLITGAASQYIEISTATWSTDQWAGGYVEIIDLWYWQIEVREIVHSDATRVYVYDNLTSKGRLWDPIPDPVNYPDRWRYTLVARSEFRTVFCEGPEDFGVVTETVSNSTFRDGSGLHDWSQVDWSDGYVIIYTATQGGFEINPEKKRIVSNTSNSVTIDGTWNGDPYECRYILVKKSKRNFAFGHVYDGGSEGAPVCMAIRDLWNAYSGVQQAWPSRISDLRNLLLQQTSITTFASVPALFDQNWSASALLPGMVNLLNSGGSLHVPNPYGPRTANGVDVFKINSPFSGFVDCWPLHGGTSGGGGEIHCGTNAIRTIPSNNWWD